MCLFLLNDRATQKGIFRLQPSQIYLQVSLLKLKLLADDVDDVGLNGNLWTGAWSREALLALSRFHFLEIWNPHSNSEEDVRRWDAVLAARGPNEPVWGVAVDDCHARKQFNRAWIMAKVSETSAGALRTALREGAFYASTGPTAHFGVEGEAIVARFEEDLEVRFIDGLGTVRLKVHGAEASYRPLGDERYVRVEGLARRGRVWSQPFWIAA